MKLKKSDIKKEYFEATEMTLKCVPLVKSRIKTLNKRASFIAGNDGMRGIDYSYERISSGKISKTTETTALFNIEQEEKIIRYIKEEEHKIQVLTDAMESLDIINQSIIKLRYLDDLMWAEIGEQVGYNEKQCRNRNKEAVAALLLTSHHSPTQCYINNAISNLKG